MCVEVFRALREVIAATNEWLKEKYTTEQALKWTLVLVYKFMLMPVLDNPNLLYLEKDDELNVIAKDNIGIMKRISSGMLDMINAMPIEFAEKSIVMLEKLLVNSVTIFVDYCRTKHLFNM